MNSMKAQLAAEQTARTAFENKLNTVVAFHASSTSAPITATPHGTVIVPHVNTNIGHAYDPQTGFFTAPVSGLYMFHATFMGDSHASQTRAGIYVGGSRLVSSVVVDNLVQEVNSLKAQLTAEQTARVANEAALEYKLITPYGTVVIPHVDTNIGNAYDPQTGFFTAPVSGIYMFHATFMDNDQMSFTHAGIYVGEHQFTASISDSHHGAWDNPGLAAIAHVIAVRTTGVREQRNKRSDDPEALQVVVDNLVQKMNTLEAKLAAEQTAREAKDAAFENKLIALADTYGTVVAFHASSKSAITATPYGTVIISHVDTNIGNAYDPQTGFFTAPVSGLYMFHATFMDNDQTANAR
nr:hypothetical protein BaRGS_011021 [Batillaria attramentaria]